MGLFIIAIAIVAIVIGVQGFRKTGLPLTQEKRIVGRPAHIIGGACILFGVACLLAALWIVVRIATNTR